MQNASCMQEGEQAAKDWWADALGKRNRDYTRLLELHRQCQAERNSHSAEAQRLQEQVASLGAQLQAQSLQRRVASLEAELQHLRVSIANSASAAVLMTKLGAACICHRGAEAQSLQRRVASLEAELQHLRVRIAYQAACTCNWNDTHSVRFVARLSAHVAREVALGYTASTTRHHIWFAGGMTLACVTAARSAASNIMQSCLCQM